jgi:lipopolysaccharide export system permease protein
MFGILDRYIGRIIFMSILLCEVTLVGLAALIKYVEQLRSVGEGDYDLANALLYVLLSMPKEAVLFFPLAALLGGLIGLGQLATSSELVVMQAAGRSKISIVMAALKTAMENGELKPEGGRGRGPRGGEGDGEGKGEGRGPKGRKGHGAPLA